VHVNVISAPVCNAHFAHYSINNPDSVHFYPTGAAATTYSWTFGDGTASTSHDPWHFYTNAGAFTACLTVTTTNSGGTCTDNWCDSITALAPMSGNIMVYPNPANNSVSVFLRNVVNPVTLIISDNTGQSVYRQNNLSSGGFDINTLNLNRGIYFYEIIDGSQITSRGKLIIASH
jgi:PKD repeat protein